MKKILNMTLCLLTAVIVSGCWKKKHKDHHDGQSHHSKIADQGHETKPQESLAESTADTADSTAPETEKDGSPSMESGNKSASAEGPMDTNEMIKKLATFFKTNKKEESEVA